MLYALSATRETTYHLLLFWYHLQTYRISLQVFQVKITFADCVNLFKGLYASMLDSVYTFVLLGGLKA